MAAATNRAPIGGTLTPAKADARGWGWQVKASINPATPRPFYNKAKELLFQDKQITSYTISTYNPDLYCEVAQALRLHLVRDAAQHDVVRRGAPDAAGVPGRDGAAPMIRMPDALESSIQKATDLGAIGVIVPTVDDALEARDAARFSRYPPFGRRSSGGGSFGQVWPELNYRATVNDNMLVVVMIETLEGVANAEEIAATHGVDVVLIGNNDLSSFSGWAQNDPRYQDALIKVHDAALKYGKYFGNAGAQYLNGYVLSADTRMVQNGPARDGWTPPARRRRRGGAARRRQDAVAATARPSPMRSRSSGSREASPRPSAPRSAGPRRGSAGSGGRQVDASGDGVCVAGSPCWRALTLPRSSRGLSGPACTRRNRPRPARRSTSSGARAVTVTTWPASSGRPRSAGGTFLESWHGKDLRRLLERIDAMPPAAPNSLSSAEAVAVLAFLLRASEMPSGPTALPADRAQLAGSRSNGSA